MSLGSSPLLNSALLFMPMDDVWKPINAQSLPDDSWPTSRDSAKTDANNEVPLWLTSMVDSLPGNEALPSQENEMESRDTASQHVVPAPTPLCTPRSPSPRWVPCSTHPALSASPRKPSACSKPYVPFADFEMNHLSSLHIAGLASHISEEELAEHFQRPFTWTYEDGHPRKLLLAPFQVHSTKIVLHTTQPSRAPYAFVRMHTQADRDRALVEMQNSVLVPRHQPATPLCLSLNPAKPPPQGSFLGAGLGARHAPRRAQPSRRRAKEVQASVPRPLLAPYRDAGRPVDQCCGRPDCKFHLHTCITVTELHFLEEGKARGKASANPGLVSALQSAHRASAFDPKNTTVFIGSLLSLSTDIALDSVFPLLGKVLSVNIPRGQDCGFVQYERKCDAAHAVVYLHKYITPMHSLRMSWGRLVVEKVAARAAVRAGLKWVEGRHMT